MSSCTHAHEMHHVRHKNILQIMRKLAEIDEDIARFLVEKIGLYLPNIKSSLPVSRTIPVGGASNSLQPDGTIPSLRRAERKMAKKMGGSDAPKKWQDIEAFSRHDTDFISQAIHLIIHDGKGAWGGENLYDDVFSCKDGSKQIDTEVDVEDLVQSFSDLAIDSATPNSRQKRNAKRISAMVKAKHAHGRAKKYSHKRSPKFDPYDGLDPQIFNRLGIKVIDPPKSSSTRKDLICKLITQIKEDLAIQAQEKVEARIREDGFWRWAGRGAYHLIMKNREDMDWATGVRKSVPNEKASCQDPPAHLPEEPRYETEEAEDVPDGTFVDDTTDYDMAQAYMTFEDTTLDLTPAAKTEANCTVHKPDTEMQEGSNTVYSTATIKLA